MDYIPDIQSSSKRVYIVNAVFLLTFLGGLLGGAYIIAENYKALDQPQKARKTWGIAIVAVLLFTAAGFAASKNVQRTGGLITLISAIATGYAAKYLQGKEVEAHIQSGGPVYGGGRVIIVGIIALLINAVFVAGVYILSDAFLVS